MCLGIPGQVVELSEHHEHLARVDVSGVGRTINIGLLEDEGVAVRRLGPHPRRVRHVEDRRGGGPAGAGVAPDAGRGLHRRGRGAVQRALGRRAVRRGVAGVRFVDEYRDPAAARGVVAHITRLAGDDHFKFMEVCGGHTHTIYRHGIEHVLPANVELVHGPGCPVCVIPMGRVDDAIAVAETPGVIFTSFGDMMRVPGGRGNLLEAKARGADVRFVYSPLDALELAQAASGSGGRVLRGRVRDDGPVHGRDAATGPRSGRDELQGVLQPRDDRAAHQGDPGVPRPAPRRLPRPGPRLHRRGQPALPVRARAVREAAGDGGVRAARHPPGHRHAAGPDPPRALRGGEPVHPSRA